MDRRSAVLAAQRESIPASDLIEGEKVTNETLLLAAADMLELGVVWGYDPFADDDEPNKDPYVASLIRHNGDKDEVYPPDLVESKDHHMLIAEKLLQDGKVEEFQKRLMSLLHHSDYRQVIFKVAFCPPRLIVACFLDIYNKWKEDWIF